MKFTDKQLRYIKQWIINIDMILAHNPKTGDINLNLQKQWLNMLLAIHNAA